MDDLRTALLAAEEALGSRADAWRLVLAVVAAEHGLGPRPTSPDWPPAALATVGAFRAPGAVDVLGAVHESVVAGRSASGTFYTPLDLVAWVLDRALDPLLDPLPELPTDGVRPPRVLDPACGSGAFVVAACRRLAERLGVPAAAVVPHVHGTDLDPVAVAICRLALRVLAPDGDPCVRVADGLGEHPGAPYDAVVGNPPFLGQLRGRTAGAGPRPAAYTDTSAVFLQRALGLVRPGGRVALVQPLSLLAARDAAPVRAAVRRAGAVVDLWASVDPVFAEAAVLTCAPVVEVAAPQQPVRTWSGRPPERGPAVPLPEDEWGPLAAPAAGVPVVRPRADGVLGDLAACTADFRDQYYGLVPFVADGDPDDTHAPLVTAGLVDPAACRWGQVPTRFAKTRFERPVVDLAALRAAGSLAAWAEARRVPKVLVAPQGRVLEAVVDEHGTWLPSVPVVTVVPDPARLWHVLAVLLAPAVTAQAAARYLGTGLNATAVKLSAAQVARLPLPAVREAWDDGARLARAAQTGPPAARAVRLAELAHAMDRAYGDARAHDWWVARATRRES